MMGVSKLDFAILVAYFVIVAVIGIVSSRLIRDREDFLMGGRRFGKVMMIFFSFGAGTHADTAVGVAGQSYRYGLAGIWYQFVMVFTLPIYWLLSPIFRRARVQTTADFFERRFGSPFMYTYAAFAVFICVAFTSVGLYGTAKLIESLTDKHVPWYWGILIIASVSFLYGTLGGLIAAVWNDFFQGVLTIVMSLLIVPFFWRHIGGSEGFRNALPDPQAAFQLVLRSDITLFWIIMMSINSILSMVVQPHIMANAGAGKSELDSRIGFIGGMILKRLMTIPWALTGVMAIAMFGAATIDEDHAFGDMARKLLPNGFTGLMLACVLASIMDNCAILMLAAAGIYTNSIHKRLISRSASEKSLVTVGRCAAIGFAVVSTAAAYGYEGVGDALRFTFKTVPLPGMAFFLAAYWRRANRWGAFAAFAAATVGFLLGEFYFRWKGNAGLPKTLALEISFGLVAGVVVSLLTPPEPRRLLDWFYLLLKTPIGEEHVLREAGLVEIPGTGSFDLPPGAVEAAEAEERELRGFPVIAAEPAEPFQMSPTFTGRPESLEGAATAVLPYATPVAVSQQVWPEARRHAIVGFIVVTLITFALLAGVKLMAMWLSGG